MDSLFYGIGVFIQTVFDYFNSTETFEDCYLCEYTHHQQFYGAHIVDCIGDDCNV